MNRAIYKPVQKYPVDNLALNLTYTNGVTCVGKRDNILTLRKYILYLYSFANNCNFIVMLLLRCCTLHPVAKRSVDLILHESQDTFREV